VAGSHAPCDRRATLVVDRLSDIKHERNCHKKVDIIIKTMSRV
jgi:hypothetical protein